jgi:hypothetical protein
MLDRAALAVVLLGVLGATVAFWVGPASAGVAALVVTALVAAVLYYGPFEWLSITRQRHR